MEEKEFKKYMDAGRICKKVQEKAKNFAVPGVKLLDLAEKIENEIETMGGKPAFPVNLSLNNNAAHYTPSFEDKTVIEAKDVLKIDIGVHCEGFIADSAFTVDFSGKNQKMVEASEKALEKAIEITKVGTKIGELGAIIEKTIRSYGFNPIQNLSGHGLAEYLTHAAPSIPNIAKRDEREIEEGKAYAIEPFACNGKGFVKETQKAEIFSLIRTQPVRNMEARKILLMAEKEYKRLPFAERWLIKELGQTKTKLALRELMQRNCIEMHPTLREEKEVMVTQTEATIITKEKEVIRIV